jgi:hypothetical protein
MPTTYAIPNGSTAFAATTWTGNGASPRSITGLAFQPDFTWIKCRSVAYNHRSFDSVRGASKQLASNLTSAEVTNDTDGYLSAFNSDGFTLTTGPSSMDVVNQNAATYVAWNWKANGSAVTNTAGSITSQVSANTAAGFSVVTYTGTGANATVGHGLGVAPSMIIVKNRSAAISNPAWPVYHISIGNTNYLDIQTQAADSASINVWNNTTPTSNVFSIGVANSVSGNTNGLVAYCWAAVPGYSAFGKYTGNGSTDGPFVYTGFRPRFVLVKNASTTGKWVLMDTSRGLYNEMTGTNALYPNLSDAEGTDSANRQMDFLSNGFKLRCTGGDANGSGSTIIYMAFAECPLKYSNAR